MSFNVRQVANLEEQLHPLAIALGALAAEILYAEKPGVRKYYYDHFIALEDIARENIQYTAVLDYIKRNGVRSSIAWPHWAANWNLASPPQGVEQEAWNVLLASEVEHDLLHLMLFIFEEHVIPQAKACCKQQGIENALHSPQLSQALHLIHKVIHFFVRSMVTEFEYRSALRGKRE